MKRARAFADVTRVKILQQLDHRFASAPELASYLGLSQSLVEHHLKVLIECDCVQIAATRRRQGRDTNFYTAKPGTLFPSAHGELEQRPITKAAARTFACNAGLALDASLDKDQATSTFAFEALALTAPHLLTARQSLRLTLANLRSLHEQSHQLNVATDTPLISIELGVAMFESLGDAD